MNLDSTRAAARALHALLSLFALSAASHAQDTPKPAPPAVATFADDLKRTDGDALAARVRQWFGADYLKTGPYPKMDDLRLVAAIETTAPPPAGVTPAFVSDDGKYRLPLRRLGTSNVYAASTELPEGTYLRFHYEIGTERKGGNDLEAYHTPPEYKGNPAVPHGKLTEMSEWHSQVFPNTTRRWWVYVPAQVAAAPEKPAAVCIIQDGEWFRGYVPTVFDNMIAKGEIPPMVVVMVNPGRYADQKPNDGAADRGFEYDTLSDQYARFLLTEILPEVEKTTKLRHDAAGRMTQGTSSGGICAWTAAWEKPEEFGKVLSWVGSFVNLHSGKTGVEGGHNYPPLIRRSKDHPKPIRVFLQDGSNDLDNPFGNWPLAAQEMAAALKYSGYDYRFVYGQGGHNDRQGKATYPDALRFLWRDWRETGAK